MGFLWFSSCKYEAFLPLQSSIQPVDSLDCPIYQHTVRMPSNPSADCASCYQPCQWSSCTYLTLFPFWISFKYCLILSHALCFWFDGSGGSYIALLAFPHLVVTLSLAVVSLVFLVGPTREFPFGQCTLHVYFNFDTFKVYCTTRYAFLLCFVDVYHIFYVAI